jgi:subtilisin-like proprotein convertase family protein
MMYVKNTSTIQESFTSSDVPITIPSDRETTFVSLLDVQAGQTILDVRCQVNLTHTFDADLTLSLVLVSPAGTEIVLAGGVGWDGDNFDNTVFTDEAGIAIDSSAAQPPYSGIYRPVEKLWLLDGENSQGQWKLKVTDNGFADGGTLLGWNVTFTFPGSLDNIDLPRHFSLIGNYPNPFNPSTRIVFNVPRTSNVKIVIFDIAAREVRTVLNETRNAGFNEYIDFDASGLASGVYFYTMTANGQYIDSKKMVLLK